MTDYKYLTTRREGPVLIATMDNPPREPAECADGGGAARARRRLADDADVRALVLTGGADGIFITHYDVGELSNISDDVRTQPPPEGDDAARARAASRSTGYR